MAETGDKIERNAPRVQVHADIQLRKAGYHKAAVDLEDLSPTGCKVGVPERVSIGETIWITFPGLQSIEGRVAWCKGWTAGVEFLNPIHPMVFDLLVARLR